MENIKESNKFDLALNSALRIPGVKVDREAFLKRELSTYVSVEKIDKAIELNTIEAEIDIKVLDKISKDIINKRTNQTSGASFFAGLPGGFAAAATVPVDILQFFGVALIIAQELAYLYGFEDLWEGNLHNKKVKNELILFLGVMFGVGGAATAVRLISSNLSKHVLQKIQHKALTKTIYYPIIKKISTKVGLKITKDTFAKGVSKAIPILGGVISGGLTYISMKPMGNRLKDALVSSINKNYTEEDLKKDIKELEEQTEKVISLIL